MSMPSAEVLRRAHEEIDQAMRALRAQGGLRRRKPPSRVEVGNKVLIGLRGGGRVEGILARKNGHGVVIESEEGADVVVLASASSVTRVLPKD